MGKSPLRVLIATDCLSEGINLQDHFTGVLHYDLPWNPNRLEQREGRVDRFGQVAPEVKACLLYGADNPIDGIVLDVLLRKVREIKRATGINVPFPEDSQSIIDTITQALLLNPDRRIEKKRNRARRSTSTSATLTKPRNAKANVTRKVDEAAEREKASRSIFAQNAIKAQEIEADLREVDEAIGDPKAVEEFVTGGAQQPAWCAGDEGRQGLPHRHGQPAAPAARSAAGGRSGQGQLRIADAGGLSLPGPQPPFRRAALPAGHGQHARPRG